MADDGGGAGRRRLPREQRESGMKFADEFRDADLARALGARIAAESGDRHWKIMEVCGGHTHTIFKYGIEDLLPPNVELMRVPGANGSLLDAKADGADVRMVYSPLDALKLARQHPDRKVVFYAIGFETTAPSTAVTLLRAKAEGIKNFSIFCNHVNIIPAMKAILDSPDLRLDGFIGAGHVSMVIGMRPYNFVARDHHKPVVIAGFEPLDIIQSVYMIVKQLNEGRAEVENQYSRVVRPEGNVKALQAMAQTMELRPFFEWRGLGFITHSALKLRSEIG